MIQSWNRWALTSPRHVFVLFFGENMVSCFLIVLVLIFGTVIYLKACKANDLFT